MALLLACSPCTSSSLVPFFSSHLKGCHHLDAPREMGRGRGELGKVEKHLEITQCSLLRPGPCVLFSRSLVRKHDIPLCPIGANWETAGANHRQ